MYALSKFRALHYYVTSPLPEGTYHHKRIVPLVSPTKFVQTIDLTFMCFCVLQLQKMQKGSVHVYVMSSHRGIIHVYIVYLLLCIIVVSVLKAVRRSYVC